MPFVFLAAAVLIGLAIVLLVLDYRRRHPGPTAPEPALEAATEPAAPEQVLHRTDDSAPVAGADLQAPEVEAAPELEVEVAAEAAEVDSDAPDTAAAEAETPEPAPEGDLSEPAPEPAPEVETPKAAPSESAPERDSRESAPAAAVRANRPRPHLGGRKTRQLRKRWAASINASYSRIDRELPSQWSRTPDGDARAVVSGFAHGREMHVAEVGGITTIALRRSVASNEILELRRGGGTRLRHVGSESGLLVAATNPELIHRIFDPRATAMLAQLEPTIARVWAEKDWSLAQLVPGTEPADWQAAIDSLAEFSTIARRLPPADGELVLPDTHQWDPTRASLTNESEADSAAGAAQPQRSHLQVVPAAPEQAQPESADSAVEEPLDVEVVEDVEAASGEMPAASIPAEIEAIDHSSWRPTREQVLDSSALPSRLTARKMGASSRSGTPDAATDANSAVPSGGHLPALGEDPQHSQMRSSSGRLLRRDEKPASIFTDAPLAHEDSNQDASAPENKGDTHE